jgi:uncharacterized delta-60 repeat protein
MKCMAVQSDGRVLIGGYFTKVNGVARTNLARLNSDGSLDSSFLSGLAGPDAGVWSIALQGDGKILIGGYFINVNGVTRSYLARLNPDGSFDSSFLNGLAGPDYDVLSITFQSDGKVLIGGGFGSVNGRGQSGVARLNPDGSLDSSFAPQLGGELNDQFSSLAVQTDGKILVGGSFGYVNGIPCRNIVRLIGNYAAPGILIPPQTQTAEAGSSACFSVRVTGSPLMCYQWYFNGTNAIGCTNCWLELTNVDFSQSGTYTLVVTNFLGAVTSAPAMLNVIPMVERRPVPAVNLMGETGSSLNVEFTGALESPANWLPLDTVSLTSTTQYYFDLTSPLPSQRFYRAWQSGTPSVVPSLSLPGMIPAITLTGNIGDQLRLDYINQFGPTNAWFALDTITLTNTSQLYFDVSSISQPLRLYRIVPAP